MSWFGWGAKKENFVNRQAKRNAGLAAYAERAAKLEEAAQRARLAGNEQLAAQLEAEAADLNRATPPR